MQKKENPSTRWGNAHWCSHCGKQYGISSKKLKMELAFDPASPLLGLYPKNSETPIQKNQYTSMFIAAQLTITRFWKQPKWPSVNEWMKKLWYIYTMEYYTAERKKELLPFTTAWMALESIMLSEMSQMVKEIPYDLTYK